MDWVTAIIILGSIWAVGWTGWMFWAGYHDDTSLGADVAMWGWAWPILTFITVFWGLGYYLRVIKRRMGR